MRTGAGMPVVADVRTEFGSLRVTTSTESYALPLATMKLELGGASGRMVFCRAPLDGVTVCVEHEDFVGAIREAAGGALDADCQRLMAQKRTWHVWQWVTGAALVLVLAFFVFLGRLAMGAAEALPVSVDRSIGDVAATAFLSEEGESQDPVLRHALTQIVARLAPHARVDGMDFRVHVVESDDVNAFALPGGQIVVFTGLLRRATRPEQVAGVLAHEMSHATLRNGLRGIARSLGIRYSISLLFGDVSGLLAYARTGAMLAVIQGYSRDQEREADEEGVRMMRAAGIDPRGLAEFFDIVKREPASHVPGVIQWLNSHPDNDERIRDVRALSRGAPESSTPPFSIDWSAVQAHVDPSRSAGETKQAAH